MARVVKVQVATFEIDDRMPSSWTLESWARAVWEGIETEAEKTLNMLDMVAV